ncbi:hypothetical protein GCM10008986_00240 [Salinibacillus aidingensis]|uniref:ABC transporter domain-containing protein n=1 Tax=Salinibacillus aidingensis TaxID=237684 RepID=A0ABP3KGZ6_9BACI
MLSVQEVSKQYKNSRALNSVSLTFDKGKCFGIVGPNGAGKSTLMKIIANVIQEYDGEIISSDRTGNHSLRKSITGYVPQEICLEEKLPALVNLQFYGQLYGLKGRELHERAQEVLRDIGLTDYGKEKVSIFSGGMKRRLNIGCARMHNPHIVIMDEPTVGIDPQSRHHIFNPIDQLKKTRTYHHLYQPQYG